MSRKFFRAQLTPVIRDAVKMARRDYREVCGLLVDSGCAIELLPVRNIARRPCRFIFDERQVKAFQGALATLGREIVGTYHSHPFADARPGRSDIAGTLDDSLMLVIDCTERQARLWHIKGDRARAVRYALV